MLHKVATLGEIKTRWTLADLARCHIALDIEEDIQRELYARRKG